MKKILLIAILLLCSAGSGWSSHAKTTGDALEPGDISFGEQKKLFVQSIPSVADQFLGLPYELGGNPRLSGTSDNSYLFFSIYALAAKKAGLSYKGYLSMALLLANTRKVDKTNLQNGDLIVLNNDLAAMIYRIDDSGKMYFIYASEKRQQIVSFNSDNPVFDAFWLENFKGFYRVSDALMIPCQ